MGEHRQDFYENKVNLYGLIGLLFNPLLVFLLVDKILPIWLNLEQLNVGSTNILAILSIVLIILSVIVSLFAFVYSFVGIKYLLFWHSKRDWYALWLPIMLLSITFLMWMFLLYLL